jgi:hypothetical protein
MVGIIGGFAAGASQGAVDIAKTQVATNAAADLAKINNDLTVQREALIRENTRASNERDVGLISGAVPEDAPDRSQAMVDKAVERGNFTAADQLRLKKTAEDKRLSQEAALEEKRSASLDRKAAAEATRLERDRYHRSEEDRADEKSRAEAERIFGRLVKARTDSMVMPGSKEPWDRLSP